MNKPNQETKTEPKDRTCRTLRRSAKKGLALLLVAVFLVTTAVSGSFTGTDAATSTTKAKSTWVMSKSDKCSYYVNKKGKKVAKFVKKSGKWYYYTYNTKRRNGRNGRRQENGRARRTASRSFMESIST